MGILSGAGSFLAGPYGNALEFVGSSKSPIGGLVKKGYGGFQDVLFGKPEGGSPADPIAADIFRVQKKALETQEKGLGMVNAEKYDPKKQASFEIEKNKRLALGGAEEQRRNLQAQIARKGMGRSSIGITGALGLNQAQGEKIRQIEAARPLRERQLEEARADRLLGTGGRVMASQNVPVQFKDIQDKRQGGISGLLGAAVGGYMGGPQGAAAGYNVGEGLGGVYG